ncbi:LLM class flavin-dependent oxidoreductase [Streptomyces sp. CL12-4]|uniref:LLM class flavin-dependent oxidoreductase n=1 Tax=Streptomyces sp. CL12-4 TaxID=2810306 RepID=UPI001EFB9AC8|nr:LLM class flavin-dependent oxidoreductase [Streptomyces sp. CL12-4]MCG8970576.1 LLM class flavin-dependent oxidoreductase [Streptomyces sp. CL12-4]
MPEITAGRSAYVEPFEIFGVDVESYDEVFAEKLDLLRVIATDGDVTWAGRVRPPRKAPAVGGAPDSDRRAGRLGLPMTLAYLGCRPAGVQPAVDLYRHAGETAGHPRSVLGLGVASHFLVGAASQGAREAFYPYYRAYFAQGRGACLDRSTFEAMAGPDGALLVGSTQEIIVSRVGPRTRVTPAVHRRVGAGARRERRRCPAGHAGLDRRCHRACSALARLPLAGLPKASRLLSTSWRRVTPP